MEIKRGSYADVLLPLILSFSGELNQEIVIIPRMPYLCWGVLGMLIPSCVHIYDGGGWWVLTRKNVST